MLASSTIRGVVRRRCRPDAGLGIAVEVKGTEHRTKEDTSGER
jgi:hypothetical protein